jgi:hypothetical protein
MQTQTSRYFATLKHVYLGYRYKYYDVSSNTVPIPYFSKSEISEHEYKLTYSQWKKIIVCYLKNIYLYILDGNDFKIPAQLGVWSLVKTKRIAVNRMESVKQKKAVAGKNLHTYGYKPKLLWLSSKADFKFKSYYYFNFVKPIFSKLWHYYKEDGSQILKLKDFK